MAASSSKGRHNVGSIPQHDVEMIGENGKAQHLNGHVLSQKLEALTDPVTTMFVIPASDRGHFRRENPDARID